MTSETTWEAGQRRLGALMRRLAPPLTLRWLIYTAALEGLRRLLDLARGSRQWQVEGIQPPAPVATSAVEVDVIICIHTALTDVRACLSAVVRPEKGGDIDAACGQLRRREA